MIEPNPKAETGCCERFDPTAWEDKELFWNNKLFVKDRVFCLFHIPITMGKVILKNIEKIQKAGATTDVPLMLDDCKGLFGSNIMIEVTKDIPDSEMVRISGTFLSKVYEGPYSDMGKWIKDAKAYAKSKGKDIKQTYFFYTTCPRCAKHYGKNYTVILMKVE